MRRLPVYLLVDVSESMAGEPLAQVQNGMRNIIQELRSDPYALETVFVSVIVFAGRAKVLQPLTELYNFYPPKLPLGGGTSLGAALTCLMDDMDRSVSKTTAQAKGDWKPIIFLFTDGMPTDDTAEAFERWNRSYRTQANLVCISLGDNTDTSMLGRISDTVLRLNKTDAQSFKEFFKWVTASIKTTSVSVSNFGNDDLKLPPAPSINLEKVDPNKECRVDENYAVLLCTCSTTKQQYLIKYAKRSNSNEGLFQKYSGSSATYKLVGAYPVDKEIYASLSDGKSSRRINTRSLIGVPACPCCGNQYGAVVCSCGSLICADGIHSVCPVCGDELFSLGHAEGGMDISRGKG